MNGTTDGTTGKHREYGTPCEFPARVRAILKEIETTDARLREKHAAARIRFAAMVRGAGGAECP